MRPVPPVVSTTRAPPVDGGGDRRAHRLAVGHDHRVVDREAELAEERDDQRAGLVGVHPGGRAVGGDDDLAAQAHDALRDPVAGLAAGLGLHPHVGDHRALVDRLDHVDDGQRRRPRPQ